MKNCEIKNVKCADIDSITKPFKMGDKVYVGLTGRVAKVTEIIDDDVVSVANENNEVRVWTTNICHATQENYEMLSKLYPHIEIELPTKQLTNGNLCRAVLKSNHRNIMCQVGGVQKMAKLLTQDVFQDAHEWVKSVAVDSDDKDWGS